MKFLSLSQLLGCPLFGSIFGLFTVLGFIVSLVGIKKRKKDGRKKRYKKGEKEEVEQERRRGRNVKRKKK